MHTRPPISQQVSPDCLETRKTNGYIYILSEQTNYEDQTIPSHPSAWSARASKTEQNGHGPTVPLTPSLPQPVKFLGLKVRAYMPTESIFDGPITNLLSVLSSLIEILFMYSREGVKKSYNVFKFGTFIGRFPSDSAASMAVKGLMYSYIWNTFSLNQKGQSFGSPVVSRATLQCWSVPVCGLTEQKERGCRHALQSAVARKRPRSFCQKCRWQVTAKHAYTLCMLWLCMKWHGAWLDGVHRTCAETGTVSCGTSHASAVNPPLWWNLKKKKKRASHSCRIACEHMQRVCSRERRTALCKHSISPTRTVQGNHLESQVRKAVDTLYCVSCTYFIM